MNSNPKPGKRPAENKSRKTTSGQASSHPRKEGTPIRGGGTPRYAQEKKDREKRLERRNPRAEHKEGKDTLGEKLRDDLELPKTPVLPDEDMEADGTIRLQVFLARAGVCSRRGAVEIIEKGRIRVNGTTVFNSGARVNPEEDVVALDSKTIRMARNLVYLALNKPPKYLCTNDDPEGRPLAKDLLRPVYTQRLFYVGRLDYMTSGLIFYTNDGNFARTLTHPGSKIEKEYEVQTKDEIPDELMEKFAKGIYVQGEMFRCKSFQKMGGHTVRVVLEEGKNKELRRVFLSENITVKRIHRVRIGSVSIRGIQPGRFRELKKSEVESLLRGAKLP